MNPDPHGSPDPDAVSPLTHVGPDGSIRMVDVGDKAITVRRAVASGEIRMRAGTLALVLAGGGRKGNVLAAARIAGVMGAKRTSDLIPLCHPLPLDDVQVDVHPLADGSGLRVEAAVRTSGRTGVEMEALTAVSVALLTIYDMAKASDRAMEVTGIRMESKSGGTAPERSSLVGIPPAP